jgi:uncharacterized protein YybS (DUF2232 family)
MLKDIANGVLITNLIFAISIYIPIVGFFCTLFIPLPTLFYRLKLGRLTSAIIPGLAFAIMVVLMGNISIDVWFFAELLIIGFVLGELIEFHLSIEKTMLYTCAVVLFTGIMSLLIFSLVSGASLFTILSQYVAKNLELSLALYQNIGISEENYNLIASSLNKIQYVLVRLLPALTIASTLFVIWINLLITKGLLKNKARFGPDYRRLNSWQAPEYLVWVVVGCGLLMLFPASSLKMVGLNGLLISMTIYFFQGIAIVSFFFEKKRVPKFFRIVIYSIIALQQVVLIAVIGIGFFDMWLNFRKLDKHR